MKHLLAFLFLFTLAASAQTRVMVQTRTNAVGVWPTNFFRSNGVPVAITNAGNSGGSLLHTSNAPTWKLKSLSGSGVSVTDQGTNLLLTVTAGGSGTVTSVAAASDWLTVSGSPITSSGTLTLNAPYVPQAGSANLTNWAGVGTNLFATLGQLNLKQDASANLDAWSGTASNLWATLGQLNDFTNRADTAFQRGSSTLTNWSGTPTNAIPRAITNAGLAIGTLIHDSNAPAFALKSISAGANVTLTDQVTNLVIASAGGGGSSNQTNFTNVIFYGGTGTTFNAIRIMSTNAAHIYGGAVSVTPDGEGVMNLKLGTLATSDLSADGTHVVIDRDGVILPAADLTKLGGVANAYFGQKRWDGRELFGVQIGSANLTNWSGISTSAVPRAITNAGASTGSLINDSNSPTVRLKSISGSGGVSITDQGTNLVLSQQAIYTQTNIVSVINTANETAILSFTCPSNILTGGGGIFASIHGVITNNSGSARSFSPVRFRLGGSGTNGTVVFEDATGTYASSASARAWRLDFDLRDDGTGTNQVFSAIWFVSGVGADVGVGNLASAFGHEFPLFSSSAMGHFSRIGTDTNFLVEVTLAPSSATSAFGAYSSIAVVVRK